jgi:phosphonate transport system substrate-binding protein
MKRFLMVMAMIAVLAAALNGQSRKTLVLAVGMFQPTADLNMATYKPLTEYLAARTGIPIELKVIEGWAGFVPAFKSGTLDLALMGPWGYVMSHYHAGAEAIATIEYDGKPTYHAIAITNKSDIRSIRDGKGRTYAFGDVGSTSGYLIPRYIMKKDLGIDPDSYFSRTVNLPHATIEKQVTSGDIDLGSDYDRNRNLMIENGLIKAEESRIIWTSDPLPNDAFAVSSEIATDAALIEKLRSALLDLKQALIADPGLLPRHYTGFVRADHATYRMIQDAGLQSGALRALPGNGTKK